MVIGHYAISVVAIIGAILGFLFWVAAIIAIVLLIRMLLRRGSAAPGGAESAIEIAERRYAAGEITEDEYNRICSNLRR